MEKVRSTRLRDIVLASKKHAWVREYQRELRSHLLSCRRVGERAPSLNRRVTARFSKGLLGVLALLTWSHVKDRSVDNSKEMVPISVNVRPLMQPIFETSDIYRVDSPEWLVLHCSQDFDPLRLMHSISLHSTKLPWAVDLRIHFTSALGKSDSVISRGKALDWTLFTPQFSNSSERNASSASIWNAMSA